MQNLIKFGKLSKFEGPMKINKLKSYAFFTRLRSNTQKDATFGIHGTTKRFVLYFVSTWMIKSREAFHSLWTFVCNLIYKANTQKDAKVMIWFVLCFPFWVLWLYYLPELAAYVSEDVAGGPPQ